MLHNVACKLGQQTHFQLFFEPSLNSSRAGINCACKHTEREVCQRDLLGPTWGTQCVSVFVHLPGAKAKMVEGIVESM